MKMSNLTSRVLVALFAIPLMFFIIMYGSFPFFILVALISSLSLYEFYKMTESKGAKPLIRLGLMFGILLQLVFMHERVSFVTVGKLAQAGIFVYYPAQFVWLLAVIAIFVFCVIFVELFRNNGSAILNIASTIFGVLYISLFLGMLIATRELFEWEHFNAFFMSKHFKELQGGGTRVLMTDMKTWGGYFIFSIFVTIWICDSAAYFAGRAFGKHKLFIRVSPNKTWEGAIAGFLFSIIIMVAAKFLVIPFLSIYHAIAIGIIIGVFGQIGDLCQSLLKRDSGIKDSSALIPGHGGFFDRFDSIIFVSPLIYLYVDLVVLYF
jgi:phosphatidate cytidylyltransferase